MKHVFICEKHKVIVLTYEKAVINLWGRLNKFQFVVRSVTVTCHHSMAYPQIVHGEALHMWGVIVSIMNKQLQTTDSIELEGWVMC
jgi:hypothetical protein